MSEAIVQCRESLATHSKSFHLASQLLPSESRDSAAVVYAWCRRADDAVDFTQGAEQSAALHRLREELASLYQGDRQTDVVLGAFQQVVQQAGIPRQYPTELLNGMQMDVDNFSYETLSDLLLYCYRVASTVGLMMSHVMGVSSPQALRHAAHLGLAMQLTNIGRDVVEDWNRSRLYLPNDLLARFGTAGLNQQLGAPFPREAAPACSGVLKELLALAEQYYRSGDAGLKYLSTRNAISVGAARRVYSAIGTQLAAGGFDVLAPRAFVPRYKKALLCVAAIASTFREVVVGKRREFSPAPLQQVQFGADLLSL